MTIMRVLAGIAFAVLLLAAPGPAPAADFDAWLADLRREAAAKGISARTLDATLTGLRPLERVIKADRRQPEFTQTFWDYLDKRVTKKRIERGRALLAKHKALLEKVRARHGVQPRFLVAFWGLETNFGDYMGKIPLIQALATLAFDPRRAKFFRAQLLAALQLMDDGDLAYDAVGSWAGAVGQPQFIPTTFQAFAVDGDGDGRRDLFGSLPDVFASAANYLSKSGWNGDRAWGREVRLPKGFDYDLTGLDTRKDLAEWQNLGVRRADGRDLPRVVIEGSVILPAGAEGPAFMVYRNYRTIMIWNRSVNYALAVGHLSDRIKGQGGLLTPRGPSDKPLATRDLKEIQRLLGEMGYDVGKPDGIAGSRTRKAIKAFQRKAHLPADGHPDMGLLERLRLAKS